MARPYIRALAGRGRPGACIDRRCRGPERKRRSGRQPGRGRAGLDASRAQSLPPARDRARAPHGAAGHLRALVRRPRLGAARASARTSGEGARRPFGAADRADRRRQDARRVSAEPRRTQRRSRGDERGQQAQTGLTRPRPAARRRPAHALHFAAQGARCRHRAQSGNAGRAKWGCRSASRPAPATRRPRNVSASAAIRRRFC